MRGEAVRTKQAPRGIYLGSQCMHAPPARNIYNDFRRKEAWRGEGRGERGPTYHGHGGRKGTSTMGHFSWILVHACALSKE
uniref:Uncharacterized protein n=1 Tax=Physcomitrium patens TaxID=3218 RepID=A0A2K1KDD8_PHYPA|nr:hypothetical protein PHYPA_010947 [Physcomitrium patens]